ncbi:MAG: phage baseplate protein [Chloroflexi bacterium]|nr:phage baseplate protein [Chloroflexota bacterium]
MRALSAAELLNVWEHALALHPVERALSLLAAASPEQSWDALAALSIGERNARLLTLREWTFGSQPTSVATCPVCGEKLELSFNVSDVRANAPASELTLQLDGESVHFRLPNSRDLLGIARERELSAARARLVARCVERDDAELPLPATVVDALSAHMAEADPQANVQLALRCPHCAHEWLAVFDIVSYFWTEIGAWAQRILREVHLLASAYGWRESDILALSPLRRQWYLDMVSA